MARMSTPPSNPRLSFVLNDFSGGLVNNVNDVKMLDNQSPDMLNMQFRIDGLIQKRPGTIFVESIYRGKVHQIFAYEYEPNQHKKIYVTDYTISYKDQYGEPYVLFSSDTPLTNVCFEHYMGELMWVDGLHMYSHNIKTNKTYKYVNPPSDFVPNPKPSVTGVVKEKHIGQFENGHDYCALFYEKWYEPCEFELEDGYKGSNMVPPTPTMICLNKDRIYLSGNSADPNMVYISDILQPAYFPASLPIQTPPNNDVITALTTYNDNVIIGRRDTIFSLYGNTNRADSVEQYRLVEVNCHTGFANNKSCDKVFHMMFFAGSDGNFYKLNPPQSSVSTTLSTTQLNKYIDLTLPPFNLSIGESKYCHTIFDPSNGLWYVQIADITLVYHYQQMAWTRYDKIDAVSYMMLNNGIHFCRHNGMIYKFPSVDGNQQYYDEYYDPDIDTVIQLPVVAFWTSRNLEFGAPARVKQFRDTYVTSECFDNYKTTVNIKYEVDYVDIHDTFKIENEISKWDSALFDVSKFTSRNIDRSLPLMINRRGRTLKVYYGCGYQYWGGRDALPVPGIVPEFMLVYVKSENKLYLRVPRRDGFENKYDKYYMPLPDDEMNQALLVHNIMGIYELKGYR